MWLDDIQSNEDDFNCSHMIAYEMELNTFVEPFSYLFFPVNLLTLSLAHPALSFFHSPTSFFSQGALEVIITLLLYYKSCIHAVSPAVICFYTS